MIPQGRPLFALVTVVVLLIFFFAGPFSAKPTPIRRISNADARLARWIEVVSPPGKPFRPAHAYALPLRQPIHDQSKPLVPINLYPLGKPEANVDEYLNARKRAKSISLDFNDDGAETSESLQSQKLSEINSLSAPEQPIVKGSGADNTPTGKKGSTTGLSPLDKLPSADTPVVGNARLVHTDHAAGALSPLDRLPQADVSIAEKPAVAQKGHAVAGLSPLDRLPPQGSNVLDNELSNSKSLAQDPHAAQGATTAKAPTQVGASNLKNDASPKGSIEATSPGAVLLGMNTDTTSLAAEIGDGSSPIVPGKLDTRPAAAGDKSAAAKAGVAAKLSNNAAKSPPLAAAAAQAPALKGQPTLNPLPDTKPTVAAQFADQSNSGKGSNLMVSFSDETVSAPYGSKKLPSADVTHKLIIDPHFAPQSEGNGAESRDTQAQSNTVAPKPGSIDSGVQVSPKYNRPIA